MNPTNHPIEDLPDCPAVALSVRPGDALRACGGAIALRAQGGAGVTLIVMAGGAEEEAGASEAEVRAAALALGIDDLVWWSARPEELAEDHLLVERVRAHLADGAVLFGPEPCGGDLPTRVAAAVGAGAAAGSGAHLFWYGLEEGAERTRRVSPSDAAEALCGASGIAPDRATAVLSTWNKCTDVLANLEGLVAQTLPFERIVVVDNASSDDTMVEVRRRFPEVELVVMPHSAYGACETFNIGFACAGTELIAILDDDVVLPPTWLERAVLRMDAEPETTAIVSTKIVEPGMPEAYTDSEGINAERYMSTFRGCASLARKQAIEDCGYYDERLFIYGNERDLTCRLLNRGFRVLQYPGTHAFHKTPFGIQMGKRSLYFHARNAWLVQLKYAPLGALLRLPFLVIFRVLLRSNSRERSGEIADATGTIGIGASLKATPGAWWVLVRAALSVLWNVPYCLTRREPCRAPDYDLPLE